MSNALPKKKKRVPANTNIFTFEFRTRPTENGGLERYDMKQTFSGQPSLLDKNDEITQIGYKILILSLTDNIKQLAAMSASVGYNPQDLLNDVGKRLGFIRDEKPEQEEAKIIQLPKLEI